jgi:DnaK suppressor protein
MHYRYLTIEQRENLERAIRARMSARPEYSGALERLHTPEYGVCAACGRDIPYVHLMEFPEATRCAACRTRSA